MNWLIIILVGLACIALLVFLVRRNLNDKRKFENQQMQDYHKTKDKEGDTDAEEKMR